MVPLFLNNACPEGSLDILYHKPACRYKMGDEIRTAVYSRFAMFRRILGVPPEGEELVEYLLALTKLDNGKVPSLMKNLAAMHGHDYYELMEHSEQMLADGSMTYGMLLDKIREQAKEAILILQKNSFDAAKIEEVFILSWAKDLQGECGISCCNL